MNGCRFNKAGFLVSTTRWNRGTLPPHRTLVRARSGRSPLEETDSSSLPRPYRSLKNEIIPIRRRISLNTYVTITWATRPFHEFLGNCPFPGPAYRLIWRSGYLSPAFAASSFNCCINVSLAAENTCPRCTSKSPPSGDSTTPPASWTINAPAAMSQTFVQ